MPRSPPPLPPPPLPPSPSETECRGSPAFLCIALAYRHRLRLVGPRKHYGQIHSSDKITILSSSSPPARSPGCRSRYRSRVPGKLTVGTVGIGAYASGILESGLPFFSTGGYFYASQIYL